MKTLINHSFYYWPLPVKLQTCLLSKPWESEWKRIFSQLEYKLGENKDIKYFIHQRIPILWNNHSVTKSKKFSINIYWIREYSFEHLREPYLINQITRLTGLLAWAAGWLHASQLSTRHTDKHQPNLAHAGGSEDSADLAADLPQTTLELQAAWSTILKLLFSCAVPATRSTVLLGTFLLVQMLNCS